VYKFRVINPHMISNPYLLKFMLVSVYNFIFLNYLQ